MILCDPRRDGFRETVPEKLKEIAPEDTQERFLVQAARARGSDGDPRQRK